MRTSEIKIRVSEEEKAGYEERAAARGLKLSEWIRRQLDEVGIVEKISSKEGCSTVGAGPLYASGGGLEKEGDLAPLSQPSPPRKKPVKAGAVCSECTRKNGGRPRRDCPNGCDKNRASALEQFDVDALEEK